MARGGLKITGAESSIAFSRRDLESPPVFAVPVWRGGARVQGIQMSKLYRRLLAATAIPLLLLATVEVIARSSAPADRPPLFQPVTVDGQTRYQRSPERNEPWYPPYAKEKAQGTLRVACVGGSTVEGNPFPAESFPRVLQYLLSDALAPRKVEVMAAGVGGQYSAGELAVLDELLDFDLDLVVVYSCHNEFHPTNVSQLLLEQEHPVRTKLVRMLRGSGVGRWLASMATTEVKAEPNVLESPPDHRPIDGPEFQLVIDAFRDRLRTMVEHCRDRGIPIVLCTSVCNLRDVPPIANVFKPTVSVSERQRFERLLKDANAATVSGQTDVANELLRQAQYIDDLPAGLAYQRGLALLAQKKPAEAKLEFIHAIERDGRIRRGPPALVDVVREFKGQPGVIVADVEAAFAARAPDGIVGCESIVDHVHPTIEGQRNIAKMIFNSLGRAGVVVDAAAAARIDVEHWQPKAMEGIKPAEAETRIGTANLLLALEKGQFEATAEEARRHYVKALQIEPGRVEAMIGLGVLCGLQDDKSKSAEWFTKAQATGPKSFADWTKAGTKSALLARILHDGGVQ